MLYGSTETYLDEAKVLVLIIGNSGEQELGLRMISAAISLAPRSAFLSRGQDVEQKLSPSTLHPHPHLHPSHGNHREGDNMPSF